MIKKEGSQYVLYSKDGSKIGKFRSMKQAEAKRIGSIKDMGYPEKKPESKVDDRMKQIAAIKKARGE